VLRSVDVARLQHELRACLRAPGGEGNAVADTQEILKKIVLADILDDSILSARAGDKPFPLRLLLGQVGASLSGDTGFAFASGLNFYFRAAMEEEDKVRLGIEVSRLYYRFAQEAAMDGPLVAQISPLLASLLSNEITRLRFESVDHTSVFDSRVHEREVGADAGSAKVLRPVAFLCRVAANNMVRIKARVWT
jgi:hypothetical protein